MENDLVALKNILNDVNKNAESSFQKRIYLIAIYTMLNQCWKTHNAKINNTDLFNSLNTLFYKVYQMNDFESLIFSLSPTEKKHFCISLNNFLSLITETIESNPEESFQKLETDAYLLERAIRLLSL